MNLLQDLVTLRGQEISSYRKAGDTAIAKIAADSLENIQVDLKTTAEAKRKLYAAATEINRP
jgi:hypothetical protein